MGKSMIIDIHVHVWGYKSTRKYQTGVITSAILHILHGIQAHDVDAAQYTNGASFGEDIPTSSADNIAASSTATSLCRWKMRVFFLVAQ